jgi:hypothetical protein
VYNFAALFTSLIKVSKCAGGKTISVSQFNWYGLTFLKPIFNVQDPILSTGGDAPSQAAKEYD